MKKLLLILGLVAGTFAASAQRMVSQPIPNTPARFQNKISNFLEVKNMPSIVRVTGNETPEAQETQDGNHTVTTIDTVQSWYNLGTTLNGIGSVSVNSYAPYMWPDTDANVDQNDTLVPMRWTSVGQAIDPTDDIWAQDPSGTVPTLDTTSKTYELDSIAIPYVYNRVVESVNGVPVVDTLVIQIVQPESGWTYVDQNTGDTVKISTMGFDINTDLAKVAQTGSSIISTMRVPLTAADTTGLMYRNIVKAVTNAKISASVKFLRKFTYPIGVIYTYKPGTKWQAWDTVGPGAKGRMHNAFRFRMEYASGNPFLRTATNGMVVNQQQRHLATWLQAPTYSSRYITGTAFTSPQMPDVFFYIKAQRKKRTIVGLNEIAQNVAGISMYPNPTSGGLNINVNMNKADNVSVRITDIVGKQIAVVTNGNIIEGNHTFSFDASSLNEGVYFCTVNTSNGAQTQRFVVSK